MLVEDNGVGIPKEKLDQVFNPFFTMKKDGSGLGLTV
ncbi:MAG: ATP-binding protein [Bacillota bacterium]